jgi:hypothetical protein
MFSIRRRSWGLIVLNAAALGVIGGSLYDLAVPAIPPNHLRFLGRIDPSQAGRFAQLDLAMLRSIGGCLLAIGLTCLLLINGPLRRGDPWARAAVLLLIGLAETNNAWRMHPFASPWYGPLSFAILAAIGTLLAAKPPPASPSQSAAGNCLESQINAGFAPRERNG